MFGETADVMVAGERGDGSLGQLMPMYKKNAKRQGKLALFTVIVK
jgi:hypothetical protein